MSAPTSAPLSVLTDRDTEIADALAALVRDAYRLAAAHHAVEPAPVPPTVTVHQSADLVARAAEMRGATREYEQHVRERVAPVITAALAWYDKVKFIEKRNPVTLDPEFTPLYEACAAVRRSGLQPQEIDHALGLEQRT